MDSDAELWFEEREIVSLTIRFVRAMVFLNFCEKERFRVMWCMLCLFYWWGCCVVGVKCSVHRKRGIQLKKRNPETGQVKYLATVSAQNAKCISELFT